MAPRPQLPRAAHAAPSATVAELYENQHGICACRRRRRQAPAATASHPADGNPTPIRAASDPVAISTFFVYQEETARSEDRQFAGRGPAQSGRTKRRAVIRKEAKCRRKCRGVGQVGEVAEAGGVVGQQVVWVGTWPQRDAS